jgi:hypothetical protein
MKNHFFFFCLLASILQSFNPSILSAQEVTDLKLIRIAKDTTFRFCEVQTKDGDTIGLRFFPERPMKKADFIKYTTALVNNEQERKKEFARLGRAVDKNINYLSAQIDSVGGPGTYASQQNESIKAAMQGAWTLLERRPNKEPEFTTVMIQGDKLNSKDKVSDINWTAGDAFRLKSGGVFGFALDFKQDGDRYVAERTTGGVTTKYILKR